MNTQKEKELNDFKRSLETLQKHQATNKKDYCAKTKIAKVQGSIRSLKKYLDKLNKKNISRV